MIEAILTKALLAKAATVLAGLSVATTGAGAADVLPQAAQDRVAATVEKVSTLDLPDSHDPASGTEPAEEAEKAADLERVDEGAEKPEEAEKAEKPDQANDTFGSIVSARARSNEDKGREFGQWVSSQARARAEARRAGTTPTDDDDDQDEANGHGSSTAKGHRPSDTPAAQANRGSGRRP